MTLAQRSVGHWRYAELARGWHVWVNYVLEMIAYLDVASMQFTHVILPAAASDGPRDIQHIWRCSNREKQDWALLNACQQGHYWTVHLLVKKGARVGVHDGRSQNALHVACFEGHVSVVKLLLKTDELDVNAADANGHTALVLASLRGHLDVMRLLSEAGASERAGSLAL